jgi:hypothetical protein
MILLWGLSGDTPLDTVAAELVRLGVPTLFLDQHESSKWSIDLSVGPEISGSLSHAGKRTKIADITAAYIRPYEARQLPALENLSPGSPLLVQFAGLADALLGWTEITPARVVNRPAAMAANGSKPFQALQIQSGGFSVPDTLITTDPGAALAFWEKHGAVIYKSVSSVRSIVSRLTPAHRERIKDVRWCPTQFQQFIPGDDYRVHVVGEKLFPCRVFCEADDYRYSSHSGLSTKIKCATLPDEIAARCLHLSAALQLPVAGIDLRRTPSSEWFCFEVNPSPGFTFYQDATKQPIAAAIAGFLAGQSK